VWVNLTASLVMFLCVSWFCLCYLLVLAAFPSSSFDVRAVIVLAAELPRVHARTRMRGKKGNSVVQGLCYVWESVALRSARLP